MNNYQLDHSVIKALIAPLLNLPLESSSFVRVLHKVLQQNTIPHNAMQGTAKFDGETLPNHFWIELQDGFVIDYRLLLYTGNTSPSGIFDPLKEGVTYVGCVHDLYVGEFEFKMLTQTLDYGLRF